MHHVTMFIHIHSLDKLPAAGSDFGEGGEDIAAGPKVFAAKTE